MPASSDDKPDLSRILGLSEQDIAQLPADLREELVNQLIRRSARSALRQQYYRDLMDQLAAGGSF